MKFTFGDLIKAKKVLNKFSFPKTDEEIFYELCFCICAPQTTFKANSKVNDDLWKADYYRKDVFNLKELLKPVRFYNQKFKRLEEAKKTFPAILEVLKEHTLKIELPYLTTSKRDWLVKNVKGLGMKTASHLLRNLGAKHLAIIDTHILSYMNVKTKKWDYLELEEKFRKKAESYSITVAELDAIVWKYYSNTSWEDFVH